MSLDEYGIIPECEIARADELTRLRAEVETLREFAQWLIDSYHSEDGMPPNKDVVRAARAALAKEPK